jgi:photosystem II stability/assembly factor-like uncharacterized protein
LFRFALILVAPASLLHSQLASFRWIQQLGSSGGQSLAGIATDSLGNIYAAGSTTSLDFPTQNAIQPHPVSSGLLRIDGAGANWQNLYQSREISANSIAIDPHNPRTIYVSNGTDLRRSTDGGITWPVIYTPKGTSIYSVAVDPSNSSVLYLSTQSQGILKSTDGGNTWTPMNNGIPQGPQSPQTARGIWIDPNHPSVLFTVGVNSNEYGLVRSGDGGATWQAQENSPVPVTGAITFDPFTPGKVYAGDSVRPGVSTDDGLTWTTLGHAASPAWQPSDIFPDPTHPGVLYGGSEDALWKSTDGGATWTRLSSLPTPLLALDSSTGAIYAAMGSHLVMTTDGFNTTTPVGPPALSMVNTLAAAGGHAFVGTQPGSDIFVEKLDPQGNVQFATYFGGTANDIATGMAVDAAGAVYVTGTTQSLDFPVSAGAYAKSGSSFVFKLNPDGSLAWSTYFAVVTNAIAVDAAGHTYIAGVTYGTLPVTPGAYQTKFDGTFCGVGCLISIPPTNGFLTEFDAGGTSLVYSTFLGTQNESATAVTVLPDSSAVVAGQQSLYRLDGTGSSLLAKRSVAGTGTALTVDAAGNILLAGGTQSINFTTTAGVFQPSFYPLKGLPGALGNSSQGDAFVMRLDPQLNVLTSTLLGGESVDTALSVAAAPNGSVLVGGVTSSKAFPTYGPAQSSFAPSTGFLTELTGDLSSLAFSTYTGDDRVFAVRSIATTPDGGILFGGYTGGIPNFTPTTVPPDNTTQAFVVRVDQKAPATPRVDSVVNAASQLAVPLSPGATFQVRGAAFGADSTVLLNGIALSLLAQTGSSLTFAVPTDFTSTAATLEVRSGGGSATIAPRPVRARPQTPYSSCAPSTSSVAQPGVRDVMLWRGARI